ncbi:hypothetical protein KEM52_003202 [Ascosphaera acerosa]|nr:hypothetical protein KEM52_003202 [Ascosphaera acerosa]
MDKFAAAIVAIPKPVLGGMTTFLFSSVAVAGLGITLRVPFNRRNRFILTCSLAVGIGATLNADWFSYVFTYDGDNHALQGFFDAIVLIMESGFALAGFIGMALNALLPEEPDDSGDPLVMEGRQVQDSLHDQQTEESDDNSKERSVK